MSKPRYNHLNIARLAAQAYTGRKRLYVGRLLRNDTAARFETEAVYRADKEVFYRDWEYFASQGIEVGRWREGDGFNRRTLLINRQPGIVR